MFRAFPRVSATARSGLVTSPRVVLCRGPDVMRLQMIPLIEKALLGERRARRVLWDAQIRAAAVGMLAGACVMLGFEVVKTALGRDM